MAFQQKDLKILWGKAAAMCSMPGCRRQLAFDASLAVPSASILIGENCHIVAESPNGPRGNSTLSLTDRNRYPNLILLCANHHTAIDQDPSAWPVELLHQVKADHELWVQTQLTEPRGDVASGYFSSFVNNITQSLVLSQWPWICDNAYRWILPEEFVDGVYDVHQSVQRAIWPGEYLELRGSIENLSDRALQYVEHFSERWTYVDGTVSHYREDRTWKKQWTEKYDELHEASERWRSESHALLSNFVVALNVFADSVRCFLNPSYFLYEGRFVVLDTMGISSDGLTSVYYLPTEYAEHAVRRNRDSV